MARSVLSNISIKYVYKVKKIHRDNIKTLSPASLPLFTSSVVFKLNHCSYINFFNNFQFRICNLLLIMKEEELALFVFPSKYISQLSFLNLSASDSGSWVPVILGEVINTPALTVNCSSLSQSCQFYLYVTKLINLFSYVTIF